MTNAELLAKIKAEIERRWKDYRNSVTPDQPKYRTHYFVGKGEVCEELLSFLDTLEEPKKDFPTTDNEVSEFLATHNPVEVPDKYKTPAWLFKEEPVCEELNSEIESFWRENGPMSHAEYDRMAKCARHFAKCGVEHSGCSEIPKDLEEASSKFATYTAPNGVSVEFLEEKLSFQEGAKWDREQMMKEAVEGEITKDNRGNNVVRAGVFNKDFEYGDKVRVIVLKKED